MTTEQRQETIELVVKYGTETLHEVTQAREFLYAVDTPNKDTLYTMLNVADVRLNDLLRLAGKEHVTLFSLSVTCEAIGVLLASVAIVDSNTGQTLKGGHCDEGHKFSTLMRYAGSDFARLSREIKTL